MSRHIFLLSVLFLPALMLVPLSCVDAGETPAVSNHAPDLSGKFPARLRAGFMAASDLPLLQKMSETGMNAAIVNVDPVSLPLAKGDAEKLQQWADLCRTLNMAFMPVFNWWGDSDARWLRGFNRVVNDMGEELEKTPCPYSCDFWDRWITPRFLEIIRVAGERPLDAILLDMEMYGADVDKSYISYEHGCYCDACFSRFMKSKGKNEKVPGRSERIGKLRELNELDAYHAVQREAALLLAVRCRHAVHKARPGLRMGVLHLDIGTPIQQGVALGFGTPTLPVLCLSEKTYSEGYTSYIASVQSYFRELGATVDLLPGIFLNGFPPENLAEQLYHCARASCGYWVFTMHSLNRKDYLKLLWPYEQYWAAIQHANTELDKLGRDPGYVSELRIRFFEAPPEPLHWHCFRRYELFPASAEKACSPPLAGGLKGGGSRPESYLPTLGMTSIAPVPRLRNNNWVYFHARKGDIIEFEVSWRPFWKYLDPSYVGLISPSGVHLAEGIAARHRPFAIHLISGEDGVYGLFFETNTNRIPVEVTKASHPYAVHIAPPEGAHFVEKIPPLFVEVEPGAVFMEFGFRTYGKTRRAGAKVLSETGTELWSGEVDGPVRFRVARPHDCSRVRIIFEKLPGCVLEDVWVLGLAGVLPFAATDPAGLLTRTSR